MSFNVQNDLVLEVTMFSEHEEQLGVNVLHYVTSATSGIFPSTTLAAAFSGRFATTMKAWLTDGAFYKGVKLRTLTAVGGILPGPDFSSSGNGAGTGGGLLPRQLAGLIAKRINAQGPHARGRVFIPFPGADMMETGALSAAGRTNLEAIAVQLFGTIAAGFTLTAGGVSVYVTPLLKISGIANGTVLYSYTRSAEFATQRRRGFYGRPNRIPTELS